MLSCPAHRERSPTAPEQQFACLVWCAHFAPRRGFASAECRYSVRTRTLLVRTPPWLCCRPMAEPFKNFLNADIVGWLRRHLSRAWPAFDGARFETLALDGLDALELKARA